MKILKFELTENLDDHYGVKSHGEPNGDTLYGRNRCVGLEMTYKGLLWDKMEILKSELVKG